MSRRFIIVIFGITSLFGSSAAVAQTVEEFYRGKTVSMVIGYPPAASNDLYARAVARHIGKHIPGKPTVVPRNMPGGGSLVAANHIYNVAPKDGTVMGLVSPTMPLEAVLGASNARFEPLKYNWIGRISPSPTVTFMWHTARVQAVQDAFKTEAILSATGRSSALAIYPNVLASVAGVKFKLVMGYKGSADAMLAMERGEVEGSTTSWDGLKATHQGWINDKKVKVIVQYTLKRHRELPDVPTAAELGRNPEQVQVLRIVSNGTELGKLILSTPDTPADRIQALRRAFDATMKDPEFIKDLKTTGFDLDPLTGEELQALIGEVVNAPPAVLAKVKQIYPLN
jgi:tripartite-type tricarboxylate transporter receptor subunit TctC